MRAGAIFQRSLKADLAQTATAAFTALFAILLTTQLVRLQREAATGELLPSGVLVLVAFSAVRYFAVVLTISLFVAVLFAVGRQHRDQEMVIWEVSGAPLTAWLRPVLSFSAPILILITALSAFLAPWALERSQYYRNALKVKSETDTGYLNPGTFHQIADGRLVVYVESTDNNSVNGIFAYGVDAKGKESIATATSGRQTVISPGRTELELGPGYWYEKNSQQNSYSQISFQRLWVNVGGREVNAVVRRANNSPLMAILGDNTSSARSELLWRAGIPLAALNLILFAIPLSYSNPRGGQTYALIIATLVYLLYSNLINITANLLESGAVSPAVAWILPHGLMFLATLVLFWWRLNQPYPWRRLAGWLRLDRSSAR